MNRRDFLSSSAAGALAAAYGAFVLPAFAQDAQAPAASAPFTFDILTDAVKARAATAYVAPSTTLPEAIASLDYDHHRGITFNPEHSVWRGQSPFELQAFYPGWLFKDPVKVFTVDNGIATEKRFTSGDFLYHNPNEPGVLDNLELPGVAGIRVLYPLNRPRMMDELISYLGASYFRAVGRGNVYGLSARGLAVDTATQSGEEFPRFDAFYVRTPAANAENITIWASLDSPRVAGAYQFVITPGRVTRIDVTARLFIRGDIGRLGVAPLTSMFLFAENNRSRFRDFRNAVHDSDGLKVIKASGEQVWRSLNNPSRLALSFFAEENPRAFGLFQRDREFDNYQDAGAWYERRPSLLIEPLDAWGKGTIALVEIPTDLEVNDNIVAFWVPEAEVRAGQSLEFRYRMTWGDIDETEVNLARVRALRGGHGGVSGTANPDGEQKFVVDFEGGGIEQIPADAKDLESIVRVSKAKLVRTALSRIEANGRWRLVMDVLPDGNEPVELSAFLAQGGTRVSEVWLYQWRADDERSN